MPYLFFPTFWSFFSHLLTHLWEGKSSKNGEVESEKDDSHWLESLEKLKDITVGARGLGQEGETAH